MKRFLGLALLLGLVQLVVGLAVNAGIYHQVDLRFQWLIALAIVPPFQTAILMWVRRDPAARNVLAAPRAFRDRTVLIVADIDLAVLALVLVAFPQFARVAFGLHAIVAAVLVAWLLPRRAATWLTAAGLALYALTGFWDWLAVAPDLLGGSAKVLRWAAIYVPLFAIAIVVLLWLASTLSPRAAGWIEIAIALLLLASVIVAANIYHRPFLVEPWKTLERVLAWCSVTSIVIAAVSVRRSDAA